MVRPGGGHLPVLCFAGYSIYLSFLVIIFGAFGWLLYFTTGSHILYYPHVRDIECILA